MKKTKPQTRWTAQEVTKLLELYKTHTMKEIAIELGRSWISVKSKVFELKPKLTANEMYRKHLRNKSKIAPATRFKKGQLPATTIFNRKVSVRTDSNGRKNYYIKIAHGKWAEVHKMVWNKANGPIPPGHVIRFKDGNTLNPALENLELVPKSLNMLYNSRHNYHPEVAETQHLIYQLRKTIEDVKLP